MIVGNVVLDESIELEEQVLAAMVERDRGAFQPLEEPNPDQRHNLAATTGLELIELLERMSAKAGVGIVDR